MNYFKEVFIKTENRQLINVLTTFLISYKSAIKTFLEWFINNYHKSIY